MTMKTEATKICDNFLTQLKTQNDADKQATLCNTLKTDILKIIHELEEHLKIQNNPQRNLDTTQPSQNTPTTRQFTPRSPMTPNHYHESSPKIRLPKFAGSTKNDSGTDFIRMLKLMAEQYNWTQNYAQFMVK